MVINERLLDTKFGTLVYGEHVAVIGNAPLSGPVPKAKRTICCNHDANNIRPDILFWGGCHFDNCKYAMLHTFQMVMISPFTAEARQAEEFLDKIGKDYEYYCPPIKGISFPFGDIFWPTAATLEMGTIPSSGVLAIYGCLIAGARTIYIDGFELYQHGAVKDRRTIGPHDNLKQAKWLLRTLKSDERLSCGDKVVGNLQGILDTLN